MKIPRIDPVLGDSGASFCYISSKYIDRNEINLYDLEEYYGEEYPMGSVRLSQAVGKWQGYLENSPLYRQAAMNGEESIWGKKVKAYDINSYSGSQQQLILSHLIANIDDPGGTAIEIGAGPGTFTLPLSRRFKRMTVVEPSTAMLNTLEKQLVQQKITHVHVINEKWENTIVEPHEYVFALGCLHVFYHIEDALIKMIRATGKRLVLLHLAGNGLWDIDYRVANAFHAAPPCYFPPASLLVNILSAMSLEFSMRVFQVPILTKWVLPEFVKRYKKMFSLRQMDTTLLESTLAENLEFHDGCFRIDERMGFAVLDVNIA
ncbi:MAG: methyltransferase domain-containing protein [Pseudomonadota bacterium]